MQSIVVKNKNSKKEAFGRKVIRTKEKKIATEH